MQPRNLTRDEEEKFTRSFVCNINTTAIEPYYNTLLNLPPITT